MSTSQENNPQQTSSQNPVITIGGNPNSPDPNLLATLVSVDTTKTLFATFLLKALRSFGIFALFVLLVGLIAYGKYTDGRDK